MSMSYTLDTLSKILGDLVDPETIKLVERIKEHPGRPGSPFIYLPDGRDANLSSDSVARLIAKTSNEYAQAVRLAGLARARYKIAEAAYKYKVRTSIGEGSNKESRDAAAFRAAKAEYDHLTLMETVLTLCESIESSLRIASESARRMMISSTQAGYADSRYSHAADSLPETDFSPTLPDTDFSPF